MPDEAASESHMLAKRAAGTGAPPYSRNESLRLITRQLHPSIAVLVSRRQAPAIVADSFPTVREPDCHTLASTHPSMEKQFSAMADNIKLTTNGHADPPAGV